MQFTYTYEQNGEWFKDPYNDAKINYLFVDWIYGNIAYEVESTNNNNLPSMLGMSFSVYYFVN